MPKLSEIALKKKIEYFIENIPKSSNILEIGSGNGVLSTYLKNNGWKNYISLDIEPPADIVGDIKNWKQLELKENSYDYIIAFELIEHIDCVEECYALLKQDGKLLMTSPVPAFDWFLQILEMIGLNQKRTSKHSNLIWFNKINKFKTRQIKYPAFLSQWGVFTK